MIDIKILKKKVIKVKKYTSLIIVVFLIASLSITCNAYLGDALYRDGVALIEWHAGMASYVSPTQYIHQPGSGTVVTCTYSEFLDGNSLMLYGEMPGITISQKIAVHDNGLALLNRNYTYTITNLLQANYTSHDYVEAADITKIRCDGVIEWCYEKESWRLMGTSTNWDISYYWNVSSHTLINGMTPSVQAQYFQ